MNKSVKTRDLFHTQNKFIRPLLEKHEYPWQVLPEIEGHIQKIAEHNCADFHIINGNILVGDNVTISPMASLSGPAVIGANTEIRPGAYIRGNVIIGENCVIGNSTELKNCILCDRVQVPHYNYVGDSILGTHVHLGAGTVCSNLKSDGTNVTVHGESEYSTGRRKLGAILGDQADIGCGCVLNPGTVVGKSTRVYPMTCLRGVYPEKSIVKSSDHIVEQK